MHCYNCSATLAVRHSHASAHPPSSQNISLQGSPNQELRARRASGSAFSGRASGSASAGALQRRSLVRPSHCAFISPMTRRLLVQLFQMALLGQRRRIWEEDVEHPWVEWLDDTQRVGRHCYIILPRSTGLVPASIGLPGLAEAAALVAAEVVPHVARISRFVALDHEPVVWVPDHQMLRQARDGRVRSGVWVPWMGVRLHLQLSPSSVATRLRQPFWNFEPPPLIQPTSLLRLRRAGVRLRAGGGSRHPSPRRTRRPPTAPNPRRELMSNTRTHVLCAAHHKCNAQRTTSAMLSASHVQCAGHVQCARHVQCSTYHMCNDS